MSLINEALKKAQRQRSGDTLKDVPGMYEGSAGRIERRGSSSKGQNIILLSAGAVVLVVLSVVIAVFVVNRAPETPVKTTIIATAKTLPSVDLNAPSPTIVAPVIVPPHAVESKPTELPNSPKAEPEIMSPTTAAASPVAEEPPAAAPVAIPPISRAPQADPKIWTFVDAIHVTGVRTSDKVSKVLMNDRVYRVNDYVDRTLGLKLSKIQEDQLTFVDENGFTYTKSL